MSNVIMFGEICILDCRKNVYSFIIKNQSFIKKSMFKYLIQSICKIYKCNNTKQRNEYR